MSRKKQESDQGWMYLTQTSACLLLGGATLETLQGNAVMGFGGIALISAVWILWRAQ